ncbi:MAG: DNA recombination protein RmuC [Candidatus Krumholzibacteria bacterium]|nr:DNA recombination protein RmuC [Candidatus Krumholzibacteria bacterium]
MNVILIGVISFLIGLSVGLALWYRSKTGALRAHSELGSRIQVLEAEKSATAEKLAWVEKAEEKMREAFKALAGDVLQSNSQMLTDQAKKDISSLVDPLKENLTSLDGHVRELEKSREGAYKSLEQQLRDLRETHTRLQETTSSLSHALRSPTVRGRWGELQLRRVVEMAGMVSHVAFDEQAASEQGRPDMIVRLPNEGVLPVDSKVPLNAYLSAMECTDETVRAQKLAEHARAMRSRIQELGLKQYWDQFEKAPDFVVMFVPNEACLGAAFEKDPDLLEYAIDKKVLISSPVTLLALLRSVAYGWQQQTISENAMKIVREGGELYSRMETFIERFATLGKTLGKSVESYNAAVGSLDRRLIPVSRRLRDLGVSCRELDAPGDIDKMPTLPSSSGADMKEEEDADRS